ncbi:hypothetical protein N657DRAFT_501510 [Parathielavia appendiculata]|uniref:Uncharacterized protein n=1 Tax=Parathielavia appendiculata TaxID=2587402 RepID=A0AAN6TX46_9PEZI|nr:hypothetical protein N657DRAFT_501510 [Parathielavia appendiculata]
MEKPRLPCVILPMSPRKASQPSQRPQSAVEPGPENWHRQSLSAREMQPIPGRPPHWLGKLIRIEESTCAIILPGTRLAVRNGSVAVHCTRTPSAALNMAPCSCTFLHCQRMAERELDGCAWWAPKIAA